MIRSRSNFHSVQLALGQVTTFNPDPLFSQLSFRNFEALQHPSTLPSDPFIALIISRDFEPLHAESTVTAASALAHATACDLIDGSRDTAYFYYKTSVFGSSATTHALAARIPRSPPFFISLTFTPSAFLSFELSSSAYARWLCRRGCRIRFSGSDSSWDLLVTRVHMALPPSLPSVPVTPPSPGSIPFAAALTIQRRHRGNSCRSSLHSHGGLVARALDLGYAFCCHLTNTHFYRVHSHPPPVIFRLLPKDPSDPSYLDDDDEPPPQQDSAHPSDVGFSFSDMMTVCTFCCGPGRCFGRRFHIFGALRRELFRRYPQYLATCSYLRFRLTFALRFIPFYLIPCQRNFRHHYYSPDHGRKGYRLTLADWGSRLPSLPTLQTWRVCNTVCYTQTPV